MSKPLKNIVVGTSLNEGSDATVRTGVAIARKTGAALWLVHAYSPVFLPIEAGVDARWLREQVKTSLQDALAAQIRRTGLSALVDFSPARNQLVPGSPHREIVDLAQRVHADLIVVGAAESARGLMGSTADRVIRNSPCPVLAVRSETSLPATRVEIAVDLSPLSAGTLRQGMDLLAHLGVPAAAAEVLFVLNPFEVGGSVQFSQGQIQRFASEELQRFLAANVSAGKRLPAAQIRIGYPREEILSVLEEKNADLAVLGTHGRSGFERLLIGSVAAGVLRSAACNLLVVPPAPEDRQEPRAERGEEQTGADWVYISDESPSPAGKPREETL